MDIGIEIGKGLGRFFLHPLTYGFLIIAFSIGLYRVKKERESFHIRVYNVFDDVKLAITGGLVGGILISLVTIALGLTIPLSMIALIGIVYVILSLTFQVQWISPAYAISFALLAALLLPKASFEHEWFQSLDDTSFPVVLMVLVLLLFLEAWLLLKKGPEQTSPTLLKSSRGKTIGAHELKRLWLVPVVLFVPVSDGIGPFPFWPLFTIGDMSLSPIVVPFGIGVHQWIKTTLPKEALLERGRHIAIFASVIMVLTVISLFVPFFVWVTIIVTIVGREAINLYHKVKDKGAVSYFTSRKDGLVIVGILPGSAAEKMGLEIGEMIVKVNGEKVRNEQQFYKALQINQAFCKLEVLDLQGEIRLVNGAIYDDEHHELGVLLITEEPSEMEVEQVGVVDS